MLVYNQTNVTHENINSCTEFKVFVFPLIYDTKPKAFAT